MRDRFDEAGQHLCRRLFRLAPYQDLGVMFEPEKWVAEHLRATHNAALEAAAITMERAWMKTKRGKPISVEVESFDAAFREAAKHVRATKEPKP